VLVSFVLIGGLLSSAITPEGTLTNNPESLQAKDLMDERLPQQNEIDELIIVRSESATVNEPAFRERVRTLVADARQTGSVAEVRTYLDRGGDILNRRPRPGHRARERSRRLRSRHHGRVHGRP
jgi:hypothetical protein